ncbi:MULTISPECIES: protein-L-isoaspartate(D-aspartate) O-methyltransferase [unclassified Guyparkeria]|uniref:protein-L-isoaspartate(D-aspartate) O-methyltransferase n=1 Tax=unclassified Guyparkeria TaxID=2626246 RepID=UPI00073380A8|nr:MULTISPECIES: protein-L-isoaspartate(D-aspartate) O-methyltransferase [unclassified Guyparkeria]KTG17492.1 protein-L-isoaspartate O-methyltransferase [Guyparkeria sp. XI15]OAE88307.1 protein-L-isoaspartate O-methyltransferase [Guyparkeria sp. WRN-7]
MPDRDQASRREAMVDYQVQARGVRAPRVLDAMRRVPREMFVPVDMREFAYEDTALPIAAGQTITQPAIVAMMVEALALEGGERVLDVGTGSGYAAAVLACIAERVYSIERIGELADLAGQALASGGFHNVEVRTGDGSLGWPEAAPFDAIMVAAGAPAVPEALKHQLAIGGRLVVPVGSEDEVQELVRITRVGENDFRTEDIADVRFVPLVGEAGWAEGRPRPRRGFGRRTVSEADQRLIERIATVSEPFDSVDDLPLDGLLERIGDARLVLIGEASHGTSEFYRARQRITRALIEEKGFDFVAIEGDWPDAARIDHYVRHAEYPPSEWTAFARFPTWMWRNEEVRGFVDWLRGHNAERAAADRVAFHGLDLYSLYNSIAAVLEYLDEVDPEAAAVARERYSCLTPFEPDPATYARMALSPGYAGCEAPVVEMLRDLQQRHRVYAEKDGDRFLDAVQNARLVANAEEYYRSMFYGSRSSWNLRDTHMFETLEALLGHHGEGSRGVIWAHNSHVGDARATDMSRRGEFNIGQLCRARFGEAVYSIGFGTDTGTVAAASNWDEPMEVKNLRPALPDSYERLCHETGRAGFLLPLNAATADPEVRTGLSEQRLERAVGVIYRPETERVSHYFHAELPRQFDEYIWVDRSRAVTPLDSRALAGAADTYPFGL